jgi:phosphoglycolate phosphatase
MKYNTYIFDLDGTILDTLLDLANAVNFAMRSKGYPERTVDEVRSFIGNGIRVLIKRAVPQETEDKDYNEALEIFTKYYLEHIADYTKPYDGIIDVINELRSKGCKTAVVSNKAHFAAQAVVKDFFGDIFDAVTGKKDEFPSKPEPDSLLYTIGLLGSEKEQCIYIGDSDVDVLTAHNAGLPCIGVTWGNRDEDVLLASGAEYIARTPSDILKI